MPCKARKAQQQMDTLYDYGSLGLLNAAAVSAAGALILMLLVRSIQVTWFFKDRYRETGVVVTQRRRRGWILTGLLGCVAAVLKPIVLFGFSETVSVVGSLLTGPAYGWPLAFGYCLGVVSPLILLPALVAASRKQAEVAKEIEDGYVLTGRPQQVMRLVRRGTQKSPAYSLELLTHRDGSE
jgi:hypothetical protein